MNVRWMKALAFLAAAGATAAVKAKRRRDPSWPRTEPAPEGEEPASPTGEAARSESAARETGAAAANVPIEGPPSDEGAPEAPLSTPSAGGDAAEVAATSAREAAILFAYDAAQERAEAGERVVCLAVGDVHEAELAEGRARVVVPLELSHRGEGRVPRSRAATLHVTLEGEPGSWRITGHSWE